MEKNIQKGIKLMTISLQQASASQRVNIGNFDAINALTDIRMDAQKNSLCRSHRVRWQVNELYPIKRIK